MGRERRRTRIAQAEMGYVDISIQCSEQGQRRYANFLKRRGRIVEKLQSACHLPPLPEAACRCPGRERRAGMQESANQGFEPAAAIPRSRRIPWHMTGKCSDQGTRHVSTAEATASACVVLVAHLLRNRIAHVGFNAFSGSALKDHECERASRGERVTTGPACAATPAQRNNAGPVAFERKCR